MEIRRNNQQLTAVSTWQHGREGIIAFLTLPAAILMGIPAIAVFMLPVNSSSGGLIALILGTAIASSYLYYFRFGQLLKNILQPLFIFVINFLKIFELLLVPVITGSPFFLLTISTAKIVPQQLLPLTTFCLVVCVLLSGIVGYGALQYWSAHLVNWAATWWPAESPGYSHLQTRKDSSEWTQTEEQILGLVALLAWIALWYFWGWRRSAMNITLSSEQVKLIEAQLALGQFSSPEEVITKALQTLTQARKHYWEWVEDVRSSVEEAEAELSRGEGIPLETAIEQLQEKFRKAREVQG